MSKNSDIASPIDSATVVLEKRGITVFVTEEDSAMVAFELPNRHGQPLAAMIELNQELGVVQVNVQIIKIQLPFLMEHELYSLLNLFNIHAVGATFTFTLDEEGDYIDVTVAHLLVPGIDTELFITRMIVYVEAVLLACLPALYTFLLQKLIHTIDTHGNWKGSRMTVNAEDCFEMTKFGKFGTA